MDDLVVLAPDKNIKFVLDGLLPRYHAFGIRKLKYEIYIHPDRDPGVYHKGPDFLKAFQMQYEKALIFLDREGSGQEDKTAEEIAGKIKANAEKLGWRGRVDVIVFEPEVEIWAWVQSPHLSKNLGWGNLEQLIQFIQDHGYWEFGEPKPKRPKEAIEIALRERRIPRSSAIYKKIAESVSFSQCQEPSFNKFREILLNWFSN